MNTQSVLRAAFVLLLVLSLAYSLTLTTGHSDSPIANSADEVQPLGAGDPAPRFIVESVEGTPWDFDPAKLENPVILLTFRGGWCPYCNSYLADMRFAIPEIRDLGIDVLFLSGDRASVLYNSLQQEVQDEIEGLGYTILSDANAQAAIALGIAFRAGFMTRSFVRVGSDSFEGSSMDRHGVLPVPAVFAIDTEGVIRFAHTNPDYRVRLPADELLAVATSIATE